MRAVSKLACALVAAALVAGAAATPGRAATTPLELTSIGAWCWFADPRAIQYGDSVVFGWVGDDGSVMVGDQHGRRFNLHPQLERDDHDNPAFHIRRDGRLMAFWSAHGGDALYYRTATNGITQWGPVRTAPANPGGGSSSYTYPNPVRVGETLHLFWSGTNMTATFATSTDDGESWSEARALFDPARARVRYIKYRAAGDAIHMAWSLGHPRTDTSGIYHAVIRDGVIRRQDGTQIGTLGSPIDPMAGDLIYSPATGGGAWIHDIAVYDGKPTIAYATFPTFDDHRYRYASWDGGWVDEEVTAAGPSFNETAYEAQYSGGITLDPGQRGAVYLSRKIGGEFEVERAVRGSAGWTLSAVTGNSAVPNVRPYPVGGGVAWMRGEYPHYVHFQTALVWQPGPDPEVPRPAPAPAPAPMPSAPLPAASSPRPTPSATRPVRCDRLLKAWRRSHDRRALRSYWRCRVRHGGCAAARTSWRTRRDVVALQAYRQGCRPKRQRPTARRA